VEHTSKVDIYTGLEEEKCWGFFLVQILTIIKW